MTDIARIAGELSEGARGVLRQASNSAFHGWVVRPGRFTKGMEDKGLIGRTSPPSFSGKRTSYRRLTPLGLSVAQHIKEMGT